MPIITPKMYIAGFILITLFSIIGVQALYIRGLHSDVKLLEAQKSEKIGAERQVAQDANKSNGRVQEKIVYREKQSAPIYKFIETYKGDANASDCDNNMSQLRAFTF